MLSAALQEWYERQTLAALPYKVSPAPNIKGENDTRGPDTLHVYRPSTLRIRPDQNRSASTPESTTTSRPIDVNARSLTRTLARTHLAKSAMKFYCRFIRYGRNVLQSPCSLEHAGLPRRLAIYSQSRPGLIQVYRR
jgi:hypothetical protein